MKLFVSLRSYFYAENDAFGFSSGKPLIFDATGHLLLCFLRVIMIFKGGFL